MRQAHLPFIRDIRGKRIAILGYDGFFPRSFEALDDAPGNAWLDEDYVIDGIRKAKQEYGIEIEAMVQNQDIGFVAEGQDAVIKLEAFPFTRKNFERYEHTGAELRLGDLRDEFADLDGLVDVVASNPPYIPLAAVPRDPEVRDFDPALALYGGADGMSVIHLVSATAHRLLKPGGYLVIEHADQQGEQVRGLLLADGWREVCQHQDLTGRDRSVSAIK